MCALKATGSWRACDVSCGRSNQTFRAAATSPRTMDRIYRASDGSRTKRPLLMQLQRCMVYGSALCVVSLATKSFVYRPYHQLMTHAVAAFSEMKAPSSRQKLHWVLVVFTGG